MFEHTRHQGPTRHHHRAPRHDSAPRRSTAFRRRSVACSAEAGPVGAVRRGEVRPLILAALASRPMHGYEVIQELEAQSGGRWRPSAGSVYPTLQQLADEGLVTGEDVDGRRTYTLTDDGSGRRQGRPPRPDWSAEQGRDADLRRAVPRSGQGDHAGRRGGHAPRPSRDGADPDRRPAPPLPAARRRRTRRRRRARGQRTGLTPARQIATPAPHRVHIRRRSCAATNRTSASQPTEHPWTR